MSDKQQLMAMLDRAGVEYTEHNDCGNSVLVKNLADFYFDSIDRLSGVYIL